MCVWPQLESLQAEVGQVVKRLAVTEGRAAEVRLCWITGLCSPREFRSLCSWKLNWRSLASRRQ